jgi:P-aminobenzoate N-oxygenase AurF
MTATASQIADPITRQNRKASQLLVASARRSFDPRVDIDWDTPLEADKWFVPEKRCTLYGTRLWASMTLEQRLASSREELASSIAIGVWTEHMLLQMVARYAYDRDITSPAVQFALTEVGDEVRHMAMFARTLETIGSQPYPIPWKTRESGRLLKSCAPVEALWALLLLTEEVFECVQREMANDETVQPLVRAMCRIHIFEEARHIGFARTELERFAPRLSASRRSALRLMLAMTVKTFADEVFNPLMYTRAGLDPRVARREAVANPYNRETFKWAGQHITDYYQSIGLIGGSSARIWRKAGFL